MIFTIKIEDWAGTSDIDTVMTKSQCSPKLFAGTDEEQDDLLIEA